MSLSATETRLHFAPCPRGVEPVLVEELRGLGAADAHERRGGVEFSADLALAYRACLWTRTAARVLRPIARAEVADADALYAAVAALPWETHVPRAGTIAVDVSGSSAGLTHSRFAVQRVKDGIVDRMREQFGSRPNVERERPDVRVHCHLHAGTAEISIDLSGEALHRRGYRTPGMPAPLKENLASALLLKCDWPAIAETGGAFLDPMCGSGTLLIEAAWIAANIAPGLLRTYWGFTGWLGHDEQLWATLLDEARGARRPLETLAPIVGFDSDPTMLRATRIHAQNAGVLEAITVECRELGSGKAPAVGGLVLTNPPYGERMGEVEELEPLYAALGDWLKTECAGWKAGVLTGNPDLGKRMGLRAKRTNAFYNGAIECRLLQFAVESEYFVDREAAAARQRERVMADARAAGADAFANRLRKNLRHLSRWARREGVESFRVYDRDLPEYALAVDLYAGRWVHVQEYAPPKSVPAERAFERLEHALALIPEALEVAPEDIFVKTRQRQKGEGQYEKLAATGAFHEVCEGPARLLVNFTDYLDTGLFLDHRPIRAWIRENAKDKSFLNLFAYTGTATVHAALGGASSAVTVDMSRTYLDWARRNMALNGFTGERWQFVQANCLRWLEKAKGNFDLIFMDPPTFSNSARMEGVLDIQRDHVALIRSTMRLLADNGTLIFSNNFRGFKLDTEALADFNIEDITSRTVPPDFARNPGIHHTWLIRTR